MPPFISGTNSFFKLLDLLNTPQQLLFGATKGVLEGENPVESAIEGARNNIQFDDILAYSGAQEGFGRKALGLVGDVVLDPLNLLALGPVSQAVRKGAGALSRGTGLSRLGSKVAAGPAGEVIRKGFSPTFGLQGTRLEAAQAVESAKRILRARKGRRTDAAFRTVNEGFDQGLESSIAAAGGDTFLSPGFAEEAVNLAPIEILSKSHGLTKSQGDQVVNELIERKTRVQGSLLGDDALDITIPRQTGSKQGRLFPYAPIVDAKNSALPLGEFEQMSLNMGVLKQPIKSTADKTVSTYKSFADDIPKEVFDDPGFNQWAQIIKRQREAENAQTFSRGLKTFQLDDESLDYLLHLPTGEFRKAVQALPQFQQFGREWTAMHASFLARSIRGLSINKMNDLGRAGKLPGFKGQVFKKVLEDDPIFLELTRQFRDFKVRATSDLFQDLAIKGMQAGKVVTRKTDDGRTISEVIGGFATRVTKGETLPEGWKVIDIMPGAPDDIKAVSPLAQAFSEIAWHPDVARELGRFVEFTNDTLRGGGGMMQGFLEHFDDVQDTWKALTLGIRPAYHSRNVVGNFFLNWLGDVAPGRYKDALDIQMGRRAALKGSAMARKIEVGGKQMEANEILNLAEELGVVRTGQYLGDIAPEFEKRGFGLSQRITGKRGKIPFLSAAVKKGQDVGGALEDNARLAHFIDRLGKGDSVTEAALSVKKYLFDYGDLTNFERKVLRRAIPFYSWMKNNSILQIDSLINKPYKYQPIGDLINTVQSTSVAPTLEDKVLPEFIKDMSGVRLRRDENGNPEYFLLGAWLPAADVNDLAKPFLGRDGLEKVEPLVGRLSPFIQKPIEFVTNQSLFFRNEIERFPGEQQKFLGVQMRKRTVNLMKSLILLSEADRVINGGIIPGFSDRAPQSIGANIAQTLGGLKVYDVDEGRALANFFYRREKELATTKANLRRARRTNDLPDIKTLVEQIRRQRELERGP